MFLTGTILVIVVAFPGYLGADIKALVQVGLLPSFVSLPLVVLYLWSLQKPRFNYLLSTFLLSAVILTHLVAGLVATIALAIFLILQFRAKKLDQKYFKHLLGTLGLTAFFVVPFLFNYQLTSQSVHLPSLLVPNALLFVILLLTTLNIFRFKVKKLYMLSVFVLFLNIVVLLDALVLRQLDSGLIFEKIYNLHLYRFQIYLYLFSVVVVGYWPIKFLFEVPRKSLIRKEFILLLPLIVIVLGTVVKPPFLVKTVSVNIKDEDTSQRFIETFSREDAYPFIYTTQNKLVVEKNKPWAYGLFTDSTPNGPYLGSLVTSFDPFLKPDKKESFVEREPLDRGRIYDVLNLFAIDGLLFLKPGDVGDENSINTILLKSGVGSEIVEAPKMKVESVDGDWDQEVKSWWFEKGKIDRLLVEKAPDLKQATSSASIKNLKNTSNWSKFSFEVEGKQETPVLVKFAYLPGWKAKENGEEIKIYRASPYLMMVNAVGKIEFEYQKQWYQYASILVSAFTFILLILLSLRNLLTNNAKN